ncbi:PAS domain S-box protein [Candidatus Nitronereus thalassa]|uniref:histidine kinase n=1 Tax=Candidatus Nitronereus thalassa TaxID=3020898 RepID=A0ABU3K915_9BACT|nr:PAS domain S-box protein [Candidatus Nitronereus thalassa]MDT7042803.1 PAS domain S-box protein [Candidatus Nitronereus thalassa]
MIWNSTFLMAMVDVAIIIIVAASFLVTIRFRKKLKTLRANLGFSMIMAGLALTGLMYSTDLFAMFFLPGLTSSQAALTFMTDLHLNYSWLVTLFGTLMIFGGFTLTHLNMVRTLEKNQRYEQIVSGTNDFLAFIDCEFRYQEVNSSYLEAFDWKREEILGKTGAELFGAEAFHTVLRPAQAKCLAGENITYETWLNFPVLGRRCLDVHYTPFQEWDGSITGMIVAVRDVTERKAAEEKLLKWEHIFRFAGWGATIVDPKTNTMEAVNNAFAEMHGFDVEDLVGKPFEVVFAPECSNEISLHAEQAHIHGYHEYESLHVHKDGRRFPVQTNVTAFKNKEGEVLFRAATFQDLTSRKEAEGALKESEERFRQLAENVNALFYVQSADFETVLYINPAFEEIWGVPLEVGYNDANYWIQSIHPEDRERVKTAFINLVNGSTYEEEFRIFRPDGSVRWIYDRAKCVKNQDGEIYRVVGIAEDVTKKHEAQSAIRETQENFQMVCEAIPQQVWTAGPDGKLDYVNGRVCDYFQLPADQIVGEGWHQVVHPDDLSLCLQRWEHSLRTNLPYEVEFRLKQGEDQTYRHHIGRALPIFNSAGQVFKWFGTNTDITDFKKLEAQRRQGQKMEAIGTLAGGIAHDFNNVLGVILGFTDLAQQKARGHDALEKNLQEISRAGKRARDLVQHILTFSRQENIHKSPINLTSLIPDILSMVRATIPSTIEVRMMVPNAPKAILGDSTQIQQIILNLCSNAEYTMRETGGRLEVTLESVNFPNPRIFENTTLPPGPYLCLKVKDTGTGISKHDMSRIFDPFYTTKGVGEGTGLGLAVVHGIVSNHQGAISVESTEGKGTTFSVFFPEIDSIEISTENSPLAPPVGLEKPARILFVDDERPIAEIGKEVLESMGCQVEICTNGTEAYRRFQEDPDRFDMVISDQTMPGMTGDALAKALRTLRADLPIVLCTGFSHTMTPEKAKQTGIHAFLKKPVLKEDLIETLNQIL